MANVRFTNITFHYGDKCILDNFSLTVDESQIMCLVGPSGCGKTTLVRCLLGFIKPETGEIWVGERCLFSADKGINVAPEKRQIGVVFQDYAVWPHLSVWENVTYPLKRKGYSKSDMQEMADHALKQVRMSEYKNHLPSQLSGGQQQRVAIARALVSSDDVIVLDEPITNLDAKLREEMLVEIRMIQKQIGTTILYITHDQEAALQLCDIMAIMDRNGHLCQVGKDEDIILRPANRFVFEFIGISNFIPLLIENDQAFLDVGEKIPFSVEQLDVFQSKVKMELGIRPNNIVFNEQSTLKAKVKSVVFLGNEFDYFITLGNKDLRVQRNALDAIQNGSYQEGDIVGIDLVEPKYYPAKEAEA